MGANKRKPSYGVSKFFYTRLCPTAANGRKCCKKNCTYAHSEEEIQKPVNLNKTQLCTVLEEHDQAKCCFAHGLEEIRSTVDIYKVRPCFKGNPCPNKDSYCRQSHSPLDLLFLNYVIDAGLIEVDESCVKHLEFEELFDGFKAQIASYAPYVIATTDDGKSEAAATFLNNVYAHYRCPCPELSTPDHPSDTNEDETRYSTEPINPPPPLLDSPPYRYGVLDDHFTNVPKEAPPEAPPLPQPPNEPPPDTINSQVNEPDPLSDGLSNFSPAMQVLPSSEALTGLYSSAVPFYHHPSATSSVMESASLFYTPWQLSRWYASQITSPTVGASYWIPTSTTNQPCSEFHQTDYF